MHEPDFTPLESRWDKWQDRWQDFMAWFHSDDAYWACLLLMVLLGMKLWFDR